MRLRLALIAVISSGCTGAPPRPPPTPATCIPLERASPLGEGEAKALALADVAAIGVAPSRVSCERPPSTADASHVTLPTTAEVDAAVSEVATAKLLDEHPLQYTQILNDCEDRAEVAAAYLLASRPGWIVGKVFVRGPKGALSTAGELVGWGYHVAPFVVTKVGDGKALRVIDPAFHRGAGLSLSEWMKHFVDSGDVTILLRAANAYNNKPVAGEDDLPFCDQATLALNRLRDAYYDHERSWKELVRRDVRVQRIDGDRVWFAQRDGHRTGWFLANDAELATLQTPNAVFDVAYDAVERGFFKGRFLYLTQVVKK